LNCPACSAALLSFTDACPSCGRRPPIATEGALAPDPLARLVPSRLEPVREIPGRRRREPTWKDEVRQRVNRRRAQRLGMELPLFPEPEPAGDVELELDSPAIDNASAPIVLVPPAPAPLAMAAAESIVAERPRLVWSVPEDEDAPATLPAPPPTPTLDVAPTAPLRNERWSLGTIGEENTGAREAEIELDDDEWVASDEVAEAAPLERPAQWTDRLQAAAFDLGLLASLWAVVIYFASRAARVSIEGLAASWPFLVGYLAFLGLVYATYFTGTCGRTVGKIVCGLRVVDVAGQAPGYPRALARAILGIAGLAFLGLGLVPIFFDPARRALHDRILRTRVVKY
jgi:uncharacterized RDD family membrane protein YckC